MKNIKICDITLYPSTEGTASPLTFRKKLDIAALLDKMQIHTIELGEIAPTTEGKLLIKSVASDVKDSTVSVSVGYSASNVDFLWDALKSAKHPRLQVTASLSTSRMEYVYHTKAKEMIPLISSAITACKAVCPEVEFCADDATRADGDFLRSVLACAIETGCQTITLCDTSGTMLPDEFGDFITSLYRDVEGLDKINLGVKCSNDLGLADAMAIEAIRRGATEIKASAISSSTTSLSGIVNLIGKKSDYLGVSTGIGGEIFAHNVQIIENLCASTSDDSTPFENGVREKTSGVFFTQDTLQETIMSEIESLGYVLSSGDQEKIYDAFKQLVSKKEKIDLQELEAIVATEAMQVPQSYKLRNFVVTTGNMVDPVAHIKLERDGKLMDGFSLGNGSVDASFLAIEKIVGCHYELDDFQIQAITQGKEAMAQTLVKLRNEGKIYSGQGLSTDIVYSAVNAYLNALNKIIYEEEKS